MSRPADNLRRAAALLAAGCLLSACSGDLYGDNRDSVSLQFGDAVAANKVAQTIDPWPTYVGDTRIPANGRKSQTAYERYRTGTILPPVPATTSSIGGAGSVAPTAAATTTPAVP